MMRVKSKHKMMYLVRTVVVLCRMNKTLFCHQDFILFLISASHSVSLAFSTSFWKQYCIIETQFIPATDYTKIKTTRQ